MFCAQMSQAYKETLNGTPLLRSPPGARHERICRRLHESFTPAWRTWRAPICCPRARTSASRPDNPGPPRSLPGHLSHQQVWLAAEIVSSDDHAPDTVLKKQVYEEIRLPRLWMIDPRYDNVEIYHASQYGLVLKDILAGSEILTETSCPSSRSA